MTGNALSKSLLVIGNVIKNTINDEEDLLKLEPDVVTSGKITRLMSKFIMTPNIIIDKDLSYIDQSNLDKVIKTEINLFTGIVTNAFQVLASVYGSEPSVIIEKLGRDSNKDYLSDINRVRDLIDGIESFDYVADALFNTDGILPIAGVEATQGGRNVRRNNGKGGAHVHIKPNINVKPNINIAANKKEGGNKKDPINNTGDVTAQKLHKDANGFMNVYNIELNLTTAKGEQRVITIPIIIYPNITYTDANTLVGNMLDSDVDKGFLDRIDQYRAGLVSLSDIIFATDLVKKYRDKKITNQNEVASYLNAVDKTTTVKELLHNKKSFSRNYNIYIFDINKKPLVEKQVKGSLFKNRYKDKLMNSLSAFSICFVDDAKEEVVNYVDDIPGFSALSYKMLSKDKNDDVNSIMKDLFNGKQPF